MNLPETCEELLAQMVSFDTVNARYAGRTSGEGALAKHLEVLASAWGLSHRRYPVAEGAFNLLVFRETAPGREWLLFESHLDTVGVQGMTVPPFSLTRSGSRLQGRGACDTKASGAAMLWALRTSPSSKLRWPNVGVLFTVDEEAGMTGASAFARNDLPHWPGQLAGIVVGEPTELKPVAAHNGVVRWTTVTRGRSAHSSDPSRGSSAILAMLRVISKMEESYIPAVSRRRHPLTGAAACSINVIRGGTQVNVIPDRCEIEVDRRLIPGETAAEALQERDRILAPLQGTPDTGPVEHLPPYVLPPLAPEANLAFLERLAPALTAQGLSSEPTGARYVTNASCYGAAGAPAVVLGPGSIAQAHTADEWLESEQLRAAVELYRAVVLA
ncbi:acetylornithine deacetylase [Opitutaceae bacterium EW11]|nr:acetylornithine deacetylase [Opitutaceae bacterium EW11]